jgi:hypothetical protein
LRNKTSSIQKPYTRQPPGRITRTTPAALPILFSVSVTH